MKTIRFLVLCAILGLAMLSLAFATGMLCACTSYAFDAGWKIVRGGR